MHLGISEVEMSKAVPLFHIGAVDSQRLLLALERIVATSVEHGVMDSTASPSARYVTCATWWTNDVTSLDGQRCETVDIIKVLRLALNNGIATAHTPLLE